MPVVHFDPETGLVGGSSDGLYVQFDDSAPTRIALTEGTGAKLRRYACTDDDIVSEATLPGGPTGTLHHGTIRRGDISNPSSSDEIRGVLTFVWNGSIEIPPSANLTLWKGSAPASLSGSNIPANVLALNSQSISTMTSVGVGNFVTLVNNAGGVSSKVLDDVGTGEFPLTGDDLTNFTNFYNNNDTLSSKLLDNIGEGNFPLSGDPLTNFETFFSANTDDRTVDDLATPVNVVIQSAP